MLVPVRYSSFLNFYPRPPRGGRRRKPGLGDKWFQISIHALREEGDRPRRRRCWRRSNFYPRPPRGGRHKGGMDAAQRLLFLSTPSARRATSLASFNKIHKTNFYPRPPRGGRPICTKTFVQHFVISIHALREEGDSIVLPRVVVQTDFYPRPPRGGRRPSGTPPAARSYFYPRPPRGGRRQGCWRSAVE